MYYNALKMLPIHVYYISIADDRSKAISRSNTPGNLKPNTIRHS